jgi:thiamine transport system substrate-binding protein
MQSFYFFLFLASIFSSTTFATTKPKLKVMTYDSFLSKWGPGPELKQAFEKECSCELEWQPTDDTNAMTSRLRLLPDARKPDVIVGMDYSWISKDLPLFEAHGIKVQDLAAPVASINYDVVIPVDYGFIAVMANLSKVKKAPASWRELLSSAPNKSLAINDPRTSPLGLHLLAWMFKIGSTELITQLKPKVLSTSKGWSDSYKLFTDGHVAMALSYTTSEAYHLENKEKPELKALIFNDPHPIHLEVAGILKSSSQKNLANLFLKFILKPSNQALIASKNWMYPAIQHAKPLPNAYEKIKTPSSYFLPKPDDAERKEWIRQWLKIFSQRT